MQLEQSILFLTQDTLKIVYYSYFHSIMTYSLIFWGNSSRSINIFRLQKRVIRIITGSKSNDSCRQLFRKLNILPLPSQYIFQLILFIVNNRDLSNVLPEFRSLKIRQNYNPYPLSSNMSIYQRRPYNFGLNIFDNLPVHIKSLLHNVTQL
jgi:hypothetical protein